MISWTALARARLLGLIVAACAAFAQPAHSALILGPGQAGTPEVIDLTSQPVIAPQVSRPFSISLSGGGVISGVVADRVVLTTDGRYAFEAKVFVDPSTTTSTAGINQVIRSNFSAFPFVEAAWEDLDVLNLFPPTNAARNATGSTVGFTFPTPINIRDANTDWPAFVVVTAPTPIALNEMRLVSGDFSDVIQVWSPVPEPQTWVALLAGVGLLAGLRRASRR